MRKSRFSETQIVSILKEAENGRKVKDLCREHGISTACFYQWKSKYGGLEASDLKRLRELEDENNRLKKMYADMALEHQAVRDCGILLIWPPGSTVCGTLIPNDGGCGGNLGLLWR